jgi:DNA primase
VDVVGSYISLRPAGPTYKGLCPFHDDHRPSFTVDPRWQNYKCWACDKYGDVFQFVQEFERVDFREALELLARRAGIQLENPTSDAQNVRRALMLDVVRWAANQYHQCLLDDPTAADARRYLGDRALKGETVRKYELGYAPASGEWLVQKAGAAKIDLGALEKVGLIAKRDQTGWAGPGYYDRFRDRVQFPIKDVRGRIVGFGGRILPSSPLSARGPKYYNSSDTPLFSKSELLYGLDQAKQAAVKAGYLAVVEGYTDVLMAHQAGIGQVVATMGTALNACHVQNLRRFAPRVVLVFDADAGGNTGVDRAFEIFAGHDVDLAIATLPAGLDPCDLLVQQGPDAFRQVLEKAEDALEFKLKQVLNREGNLGVEGQRRAVDAVLGIIALAPPLTGQAGAVRTQLMVNRIAQRLALKEELVWLRLDELKAQKRPAAGHGAGSSRARPEENAPPVQRGKALPEERELLEVLLAEEALVAEAAASIPPEDIGHPGLRRLLSGLYALLAEGVPPTLDQLRARLLGRGDDGPLAQYALNMQEVGLQNLNRAEWFRRLLARFQERRTRSAKQKLQTQLQSTRDHQAALELLRHQQLEQPEGMRDEG